MRDSNTSLPIAIGSDHAGFRYKTMVRSILEEMGLPYQDFGACSEQSVDYPVFAAAVAEAVATGKCRCGILVCGTGIGMSIAANKVPGVRAALCGDTYSARVSRQHNDANVLALPQRVIGEEVAREVVEVWLTTPFSGEERHVRRLDEIREIERRFNKQPPSTDTSNSKGEAPEDTG
jgi:ribose 5-phosphate isomerase B